MRETNIPRLYFDCRAVEHHIPAIGAFCFPNKQTERAARRAFILLGYRGRTCIICKRSFQRSGTDYRSSRTLLLNPGISDEIFGRCYRAVTRPFAPWRAFNPGTEHGLESIRNLGRIRLSGIDFSGFSVANNVYVVRFRPASRIRSFRRDKR